MGNPPAQPAGRAVGHWAARINRVKKDIGLTHGFRSGLEERNAEFLEAQGHPVIFEAHYIPYLVPETRHRYTYDFLLINGIIVETKGWFKPEDRAKHLFVKVQYPELDIRFIFQNPNAPIVKGSLTTYAMWCRKHGIKYAATMIPKEWLDEEGPVRKPHEVIAAGPYGYMRQAA